MNPKASASSSGAGDPAAAPRKKASKRPKCKIPNLFFFFLITIS